MCLKPLTMTWILSRPAWTVGVLQVGTSPREVRQIASHRHTLLTLDDDRRRLSEEARHKREELAAVGRRIDELLVECQLVPEADPLEHLRMLKERLDADRVLSVWVFRMSRLVLSLHAVLRDGDTGRVRYARTLSFRSDNDRSWSHAAKYLLRDMATIPEADR